MASNNSAREECLALEEEFSGTDILSSTTNDVIASGAPDQHPQPPLNAQGGDSQQKSTEAKSKDGEGEAEELDEETKKQRKERAAAVIKGRKNDGKEEEDEKMEVDDESSDSGDSTDSSDSGTDYQTEGVSSDDETAEPTAKR